MIALAAVTDRLRIAQIAPIANPVGPGTGESIEQLVGLLSDELVRRGHSVTVFATGDSITAAELDALYERGYEHDNELWDWHFHETMNAAHAFERAADFDLIHSHSYHFALPYTRLVSTPVLHTYHVEVGPDVLDAYRRYPEACLVAISSFQRSTLGDSTRLPMVHHGIDTDSFPLSDRGGDHLVYLGRMIEDKGPHQAVRVARELGMELVLAGPGGDFFDTHVRPLVDGEQVRYIGPVGPAERNDLLAGAAALLYPLVYPEPFGLAMVEAMACGTPVAAVGIGAVPEIVEPGVTGALADSVDGLADAVPRALELDRTRVAARARERFDYRRMVDDYEALYRRLTEER